MVSIWDNLEEVKQDENGNWQSVIPISNTNTKKQNKSIWDGLEEVTEDENGNWVNIAELTNIEKTSQDNNDIIKHPILDTIGNAGEKLSQNLGNAAIGLQNKLQKPIDYIAERTGQYHNPLWEKGVINYPSNEELSKANLPAELVEKIQELSNEQNFNNNLLNQYQPKNVTPVQGVKNIASDIGKGVLDTVKGLPQIIPEAKRAISENANYLQNSETPIKDLGYAIVTGMGSLIPQASSMIVNLPRAVTSSYQGKEYKKQFDIPETLQEVYWSYLDNIKKPTNEELKRRQDVLDKLKQQEAAQFIGTFGLPMVGTAGNALKATKTISQLNNVNKGAKLLTTAKKAQNAATLAEAAKTGALWGVATSDGSLRERSQAAATGAAIGTGIHGAVKGTAQSAQYALPILDKSLKTTAKGVKEVKAELVNRLNPENYETVIEAKPIKNKSGQTVYETNIKKVYKGNEKLDSRLKNAKDITQSKNTDSTTGESSEIKYSKPQKANVEYPLQQTNNIEFMSRLEEIAPNTARKITEKAARTIGTTENNLKDINNTKTSEVQKKLQEIAPNTFAKQQEAASKNQNEITHNDNSEALTTRNADNIQKDKEKYLTNDGKKPIENFYKEHAEHIEQEPEKYKGSRHPHDILKYLGSTNGERAVIKTPIEDVAITRSDLIHLAVDNETERLGNINKVVSTLKNPNIVIDARKNKNNYHYYVKAFSTENKTNTHLQIIKLKDDGNFYVTNYPLRNTKFEELLKQGQVVYDLTHSTAPTESLESAPVNNSITNSVDKFNGNVNKGKSSVQEISATDNELEKVSPKTFAKQNTAAENDIDNVAREYSELLGQNEVREFHKNFADALVNKKADIILDLIASGRGTNENSKKMFTKYTGIKLPSTIDGKINTVLDWAGINKEEWRKNKADKAAEQIKKREEEAQKEKEERFLKDLSETKRRVTAWNNRIMSSKEFLDELKKQDYKLQKTKQGIKPIYRLVDKDGTFYSFSKPAEKYYIDKIYNLEKLSSQTENNIAENQNIIYDDENITKEKDTGNDGQKLVRGRNQAGNRGNTEELSSGLQTREKLVRGQSEVADRNNQSSSGRDGNARTSNNEYARNERLTETHKALIEKTYKNQHELNTEIENFINNKEYEQYNGNIPEEVKNWLKKYAGSGGLEKQGAEGKGLLSEYYTPKNIVSKMWDLTAQYIKTDGAKVLEPSVGIGRFLEYAPENVSFDVVEMNPISAKITELLYPNANVTTGEFQERFIDKKTSSSLRKVTPEYDIVIGNPPYGTYSGRYKGLGEGKGIARIEQYFIKRGLDTLKENGIMTFIVPSSFLDGTITKVKQEIGTQAQILDAYRLPENTFDTTSIGTDIIVLRKNKTLGSLPQFNAGNWFKQHPEKILGTVENRKNRFGKEETFVKGDKNAVDNIDTTKKDIKETINSAKTETKTASVKKTAVKKVQTPQKTIQGKIEYKEYEHKNPVSDEELKYFADTKVDGTLPSDKYSPDEKVNQFNGKLYNDFNYLQGDIYEKLDCLEKENISDKQKDLQRKKLMSVLPKPKKLEQINLTPTSDFIREFPVQDRYYDKWNGREVEETTFLDRKYLDYVRDLSSSERNNISVWNIEKYVRGDKISVDYKGNPTKEEKENQRTEYLTKLKTTVDKTFNDFLNSELSEEDIKNLTDKWNRTFNNLYTPDYKKMPMIVRGLNSQFKGEKLKLQDVQVEGINFLTNKGTGLLGFEVGVGKTLSGIISTVQNMQMGRCKRPLIIVPKQVKPNWISEIHEAFPNIKVNDLDNLGKFTGQIEEGTLSIATFQALDNIWYKPETLVNLLSSTYQASNDFNRDSTKRGREQAKERNEEFVGKAEKDNKKKHTFEDLGIDHITVDEAHNFKNLFSSAKADGKQGNIYTRITGAESTRAKRMFLAAQYILSNNGNRNVFMLTATPFNNSPLEVFNMLSYIAKDKLDNMGLYNVYQFMENYVDIAADWVVDSKNNVVYKQIPKAFKNLQSLQSIIDTCMLIRSAEDAKVKRPNKHTKRVVLEPTQEQLELIANAETEAIQNSDSKDRNNGAVLRAISKARTATLSPDIYNNNYDVSPEDFIKNSPKLNYVMNAVEAMKKKRTKTAQLIYMPLGVEFLPKMKDYLINKGVYKSDEIAIIKSGVDDDKISAITESFNDKDGKIKLVIGTNKMREGMNLNGHTSVLYVPYMDWNPTDYMQIAGRIWRRGNEYKDIRIVVPLLKDSSDPFMFQKLDEKTSRINNIMDRGKDYIDTSELDTAEEKINMITNPDKKAAMFSQIEQQKLNNEKNKFEGQLETVRYYKGELETAQNEVTRIEEHIKGYEERLKEITDKESWSYKSTKGYIDEYKKDLGKAKQSLKYTNTRIERLELDFNGKDSEENIQKQIKEVEKKIKNLKETTELKLAKYKDEYEKNRKSSKSIEELIKEFDKDTDELYENMDGEYFHIPNPIKNIKKSYEEYTAFQENLKQGKTIAELTQKGGELEAFAEDLKEFGDYKIIKMSNASDRNAGRHREKAKIIEINHKVIGNDISKFAETLMHEIKHAEQIREFNNILEHSDLTKSEQNIVKLYANGERAINENLINKLLNKGNFTREQLVHIKNKRDCSISNKALQRYLKFHEDTLKKIWDKTKNFDEKTKAEFIDSLPSSVKKVYDKYRELYQNYKYTPFEEQARINGAKYAERVKNGNYASRQRFMGISGQRNAGTGYEDSSAEYGKEVSGNVEEPQRGKRTGQEDEIDWYSFEEPTSRSEKLKQTRKENIKKAKELETAAEYKPVIKDYIRTWNGSIGKDRFDVNKSINSFIKHVNNIVDDYNKNAAKKNKIEDVKNVREIMPFLRERTDFPESLNRPDLKRVWNIVKSNSQLKQRLTYMADTLSGNMTKYYENYKYARANDEKTEIENPEIKNYITHDWKLKDKKQESLLTNYFTTSSKFAQKRKIATWYDGIEGIEADNGEIIKYTPNTLDYAELVKKSTDSLIKATHDKILADKIKELKTSDGVRLVMPANQAPSNWKKIDHPALNKWDTHANITDKGNTIIRANEVPVKVHPDIARTIEAVFETPKEDNALLKFYDNITAAMKQAELGFSGFHMGALSEAAVGNIGGKETLKILNPVKIWDEVKKGNWSIYKEDSIAKQAIDDGLQIGATLDLDRNGIEKMLDNVELVVKKIPIAGEAINIPVKFVNKANKLNNKILWDYLHNNYKLKCYQILINNTQEKLGRVLEKEERQEIAQWTNDSFGGQVWELLGIKPSEIKAAKRLFLSPDWLLSTTRQGLGIFASGTAYKELREFAQKGKIQKNIADFAELFGLNAETEEIAKLRQKKSLQFWFRAAAYAMICYNMLNIATRAWDKHEHPEFYKKDMKWYDYTLWGNSRGSKTYLFIGRNKESKEKYWRLGKQFREIPESITEPRKHLGNKAAPILQFASQAIHGESIGGYKNYDMYKNIYPYDKMKEGGERVKATAKLAAQQFVPYSFNDILNPNKEFSPASLFAPVSSGMTKRKAKEEFLRTYENSHRIIRNPWANLDNDIADIERSMKMNGFNNDDIKKVRSEAKNEFTQAYKKQYISAIEKNYNGFGSVPNTLDRASEKIPEIKKINNELRKNQILTNEDRQKIYKKAFEKFMKDYK